MTASPLCVDSMVQVLSQYLNFVKKDFAWTNIARLSMKLNFPPTLELWLHSDFDSGYKIRDAGCKMQDSGYKIQDAGCKMRYTGFRRVIFKSCV